MSRLHFHAALTDRGVQICDAIGVGFIALAARPRTAFAYSDRTYLLVSWHEHRGHVNVQVQQLAGPTAELTDADTMMWQTTISLGSPRPAETTTADFGVPLGIDFTTEPGDRIQNAPDQTERGISTSVAVTVREIRAGHDDIVWPLSGLDIEDVRAMIDARIPGGSVHLRDLVHQLRTDGASSLHDSIYVVESDDVRRTGRRAISGDTALAARGNLSGLVDLADLSDVQRILALPAYFIDRVALFAAQLAVNGVADYRYESALAYRGTWTYTATDSAEAQTAA